MNKVADYLKENLRGEVSTDMLKRQYFSGDASALKQLPQIIVAPYDEQDIRKVLYFSWQLAERGRVLPIVARGAGTDMSGAAIGQSIVLNMQPHLNKILEFNDKQGIVAVEPGVNFGKLHHTLTFSHGCYIPAYPTSLAFSTIGGAIANNSGGVRSLQNGPMINFVRSLKVVLANGDIIETKRITKKEASKKMGLTSFEGEIYRAVDALINDNSEAINNMIVLGRGGIGYNLKNVRADNGSVDLTPLFVGSQGTLGVVVEAEIATSKYQPGSRSLMFILRDRAALGELVKELKKNDCLSIDYFDPSILMLARQDHPGLFVKEFGDDLHAGVLLAEFPYKSNRSHNRLSRKLENKLVEIGVSVVEQEDEDLEYVAERLRNLPHDILTQRFGSTRLVPGIDDATMSTDSINDFLIAAESLFKRLAMQVVVHVRAGDGYIHAYPLIDLNQLGDRQKLLRLQQEYYKLVLEFGGSVVGEHCAGRIRGVYAKDQLGDVLYGAMHRIKQIFDPYGILNPGVKIDVDQKATLGILSTDFEIPQLYQN